MFKLNRLQDCADLIKKLVIESNKLKVLQYNNNNNYYYKLNI
jgi:hypothetical protein